jgi:hypothetical protein
VPEASPNPKRGAQPGKFQRPKPIRIATQTTYECERVDLDALGLDLNDQIWWAPNGDLYFDRRLTEATGLTIVRLRGSGGRAP